MILLVLRHRVPPRRSRRVRAVAWVRHDLGRVRPQGHVRGSLLRRRPVGLLGTLGLGLRGVEDAAVGTLVPCRRRLRPLLKDARRPARRPALKARSSLMTSSTSSSLVPFASGAY